MSQSRLYGDLAWIWSVISTPEEYAAEAEEVAQLIQQYVGAEAKKILHLGCGGGHLDHQLKNKFSITSVDISEAMLGLAKQLNPEVEYISGDMRIFRSVEKFDAVLVSDAIGYMLTEADLTAVFATAVTHLRNGGIFIAYVQESAENFEQYRTHSKTYPRPDLSVTYTEVAYDPDSSDTTFELIYNYMIRRSTGVEVEVDRHLNGVFSMVTWENALKKNGFQVNRIEFKAYDFPAFVCVKR